VEGTGRMRWRPLGDHLLERPHAAALGDLESNGRRLFATAGMKVWVEAYNHRGGGEWVAGVVFLVPIVYPVGNSWKQERPFRIDVTFDATGRDFAFDPRRVTLASETIRPMAPLIPTQVRLDWFRNCPPLT
jgi:hypothetical protein